MPIKNLIFATKYVLKTIIRAFRKANLRIKPYNFRFLKSLCNISENVTRSGFLVIERKVWLLSNGFTKLDLKSPELPLASINYFDFISEKYFLSAI